MLMTLSPVFVLCMTMLCGYTIGKIRLFRFSLGLAGILFAGIAFGYGIQYIPMASDVSYITDLRGTVSSFSTFGSALFLSVIGLDAGVSVKKGKQGSLRAFGVGMFISLLGLVAVKILLFFDPTADRSTLLGILCGALTSTPGLSVLMDMSDISSQNATLGYAAAYLPAVLSILVFFQIIARKEKKLENANQVLQNRASLYPSFAVVLFVSAAGLFIGSIHLPFADLSIGTTLGVLFMSLFTGVAFKRRLRISKEVLSLLKSLGLSLFFAATGLSAGMQFRWLSPHMLLYGILLTVGSLLFGYLFCLCVFHRSKEKRLPALAGAITSSPALGILLEKDPNTQTEVFSFAYLGALITLLVGLRML